MYVEVIVRSKARYADKLFTYSLPKHFADQVKIGHRLSVPMGKSNKPIEAFVFNIKQGLDQSADIYEVGPKIKDIIDILDEDPMLTKDNIRLIYWMRKKYMCTFVDCINLFYPKGYRSESKKILLMTDGAEEIYRQIENFEDEELEIASIERDNMGKDIAKSASIETPNIESKDLDTYRSFRKLLYSSKEAKYIDYDEFVEGHSKASLSRLIDKGLIKIGWTYIESKNEKKIKYISLAKKPEELDKYIKENKIRLGKKQEKIIEFLKLNQNVCLKDLCQILDVGLSSVNSLIDKALIDSSEVDYFRSYDDYFKIDKREIFLNEDQTRVSQEIFSDMENHDKKPYLLHGVTGSGKTEVYLDLIEKYLGQGMDSIFLVPEIALTPQMIARVKNRFGNIVGVFHSQLSAGEKHDVYRQIRRGNIRVLVGTRSSIFMPFSNLGLIIIDEEHDSSYQSDMTPKYDAIEVARTMAKIYGINLVLGSATPKVSDYYRALEGGYKLVELVKRANNRPMPKIDLVDMRKSFNPMTNNFLSDRMLDEVRATIEAGNQVILFLNRRGYANFVTCKECGYVFKCGNCDISLTYHKSSNKGVCHYCGHEENIARICPQCGGMHISSVGTGTQRIEEEIRSQIESAKVLRVDKDTTSKKGDLENILIKFQNQEANILIGTQIITKGHDFDNVTLVGIVSADMMLNYPDYKAAEMTFQLVTQVAGRAGRAEKEGRVILQTYDTDHFAIRAAVNYDYKGFYNNEIRIRKTFGYEPFNNMLRLVFSGNNYKKVKYNSEKFFESILYLIKHQCGGEDIQSYSKSILGPNECSINRINSKYRWQVVIKDRYLDIKTIKNMVKYLCISKFDDIFDKDIQISIEVNPNSYI